MSIVEFLLARIAEDESIARDWNHQESYGRNPGLKVQIHGGGTGFHDLINPGRTLAECQAKRALIDEALRVGSQVDGTMGCCHEAAELRQGPSPDRLFPDGCPGAATVRQLLAPGAAVYSDDPDYDPSWRP